MSSLGRFPSLSDALFARLACSCSWCASAGCPWHLPTLSSGKFSNCWVYSANVPWPKVVWGQKTRQQQKTGIAPNLILINIITIIIITTTITIIIIIIMLFIMMLIIICITVSLWWEVHAPCWSPQSILISSRPHILNHHGYRSKLGTQIVRWFMSIHVNIHVHTWQYIC